jgi:hypothetical protein
LIAATLKSTFAAVTGTGRAQLNVKANIQDVTRLAAPLASDGNSTLPVSLMEKGEPGSADTIGIALWDRNGELLYASGWNGVSTAQPSLGSGHPGMHETQHGDSAHRLCLSRGRSSESPLLAATGCSSQLAQW